MATLTSTGVTFSDGTALASAAPTISQVGSIVAGCYIISSPTSPNNDYRATRYAAGLTVAGSSIAYDINISLGVNGSATVSLGVQYRRNVLNIYQSPMPFPSNGAQGASYYVSGDRTSFYGGSSTYSTLGGSWRSLSPMTISLDNYGCSTTQGTWPCIAWIRYA